MDDLPDQLDAHRATEWRGHMVDLWGRRIVLALCAALCAAALIGLVGQGSSASTNTGPRGALSVDSPQRLRGGLLYQARFTLRALGRNVPDPKLVLNQNWFDGLTNNTTVPSPTAENAGGGRIAWSFPPLARGRTLTVLTEWQVNPTTPLGSRSLFAAFDDGNRRLAVVRRTLTIFP